MPHTSNTICSVRRPSRRKLVMTAVCLILAIIVAYQAVFHLTARIPLRTAQGNVTACYVMNKRFLTSESCWTWLTEEEIFDGADLIFSGKITKLRRVKLNFDGFTAYHTLLTVRLDRTYCGYVAGDTVTVFAPEQYANASTSDGSLLNTLRAGDYGIFLTSSVRTGDRYEQNGCSFDRAELCDATIGDTFRFGFIREAGKDARCCDTVNGSNVYASLTSYDWDSVVAYVERMLDTP